MPVHDWTHLEPGIFHAFHQQWIIAISNVLNQGVLPEDYYALPEQHAAGFGHVGEESSNLHHDTIEQTQTRALLESNFLLNLELP